MSQNTTDFLYDKLHPDLLKLDKDRKKIANKLIFLGIFIFVLSIIASSFFSSMSDDGISFAPFIIGFILFGLSKYFLTKGYISEFKDKVIEPLIKHIDKNLHYNKDSCIYESAFKKSKLFKHSISKYSGNDLVKGEMNGVKLRFSDIHAQYETRDSKGNRSYHTIFEGLFIIADFNKEFKGQTTVLPDTAEKTFGKLVGSWLQSKNMSRNDLVKMDNPEFEKNFVVYGSDQIEARYILTHSMMQRILDFKKLSSVPLSISFNSDQIYLALAYNKDLFEPTVFTSLLKFSLIKEYVSTLELATGIIQDLKLNEKLWSKI